MRAISVLAMLLLFASGCIFSPKKGREQPPPPLPDADSPQNAMLRFQGVYQAQSLVNYEPLLTSDFRYTFSLQADPGLVNLYPNWGKDDEVETTRHLFEGFVNSEGKPFPAARSIALELGGIQYGTDYSHADSAEWYQAVVVPGVRLTIEIPGEQDPVIYEINGRHEFYLVRGDAAVLGPGQEARTDRWYIRRWDDKSAAIAAPTPTEDRTRVSTWGRLRAEHEEAS